MSPKREAVVRDVLIVNAHAGSVVVRGGLKALLADLPEPDLVLACEVPTPKSRRALRRLFPRRRWYRVGPTPGETPGARVGTYVLASRRAFRLRRAIRRRLTGYASGMHPARELTATLLEDRASGRLVDASSVHLWHVVGRTLGEGRIGEGHVRQLRAYARYHRGSASARAGSVQLAGGDWNQRLDGPFPDGPADLRVARVMASAGMIPAWRADGLNPVERAVALDDLFLTDAPYVRVLRRRLIDVPGEADDHRAVWVRLAIDPA